MNIKTTFYEKILESVSHTIDIIGIAGLTLLPGVVLSVIASIFVSVFHLLRRRNENDTISSAFGLTFVLTFVAFVVGFSSTNTRETIIGDLIPALLGGFGALLIYSYIKQQIQASSAAIAAVTFSISLFCGLIAGGQMREGLSPSKNQITNFGYTASFISDKDGHVGDIIAFNAALKFLEVLKTRDNLENNDKNLITYIETTIVPRKNFHMEKGFSSEEMDKYFSILDQDPNFDFDTYKGNDAVLFSNIHFALNPLRNIQ